MKGVKVVDLNTSVKVENESVTSDPLHAWSLMDTWLQSQMQIDPSPVKLDEFTEKKGVYAYRGPSRKTGKTRGGKGPQKAAKKEVLVPSKKTLRVSVPNRKNTCDEKPEKHPELPICEKVKVSETARIPANKQFSIVEHENDEKKERVSLNGIRMVAKTGRGDILVRRLKANEDLRYVVDKNIPQDQRIELQEMQEIQDEVQFEKEEESRMKEEEEVEAAAHKAYMEKIMAPAGKIIAVRERPDPAEEAEKLASSKSSSRRKNSNSV